MSRWIRAASEMRLRRPSRRCRRGTFTLLPPFVFQEFMHRRLGPLFLFCSNAYRLPCLFVTTPPPRVSLLCTNLPYWPFFPTPTGCRCVVTVPILTKPNFGGRESNAEWMGKRCFAASMQHNRNLCGSRLRAWAAAAAGE
ncbi:unnamed protein product [Phaeothamnion confervicola]